MYIETKRRNARVLYFYIALLLLYFLKHPSYHQQKKYIFPNPYRRSRTPFILVFVYSILCVQIYIQVVIVPPHYYIPFCVSTLTQPPHQKCLPPSRSHNIPMVLYKCVQFLVFWYEPTELNV